MENMVEVVIDSVRVSLTNQQRIVVLRQVGEEKYLPIWIGPYEAEAITIALQEIEVARPQTHDLLKNLLTTFSARLLRVEVSTLKDDVFYGNLVIELDGKLFNVDTRPSDALALSVRSHVPILVSKEVMDSAGVMPEQDLQEEAAEDSTGSSKPKTSAYVDQESEERLSIFEDFLKNMDDKDSNPDEDEDPGNSGEDDPENGEK